MWTKWDGEDRRGALCLWKLWRVGSWRWSLYELHTMFPENWPTHRPVFFQIGRRSPETGVQMCADNPSLPPLPLFLFLSLSFSFDFPPSHGWWAKKKKKAQQDREESHIVHRAEFGRPQIRDSGRLVMIRGSGWVMGSNADHLFPALPIQRERKKGCIEAWRGWHIPFCKT